MIDWILNYILFSGVVAMLFVMLPPEQDEIQNELNMLAFRANVSPVLLTAAMYLIVFLLGWLIIPLLIYSSCTHFKDGD